MQMYEALRAYNLPDEHGHFGTYGGVFVAETLEPQSPNVHVVFLSYDLRHVRGHASFVGT